MKKYSHLAFFGAAGITPIVFMLVYHAFMEDWGPGYAFFMAMSCLFCTIMLCIQGFIIADRN